MSPTGWRRCIRSLKLQISFRKRTTNYRAVSREMTCKDKASYDSTPPCASHHKSPISMVKNLNAQNIQLTLYHHLNALGIEGVYQKSLYTIKRGLHSSKRGMNFIRAALYPVQRSVFLVDCDALSH